MNSNTIGKNLLAALVAPGYLVLSLCLLGCASRAGKTAGLLHGKVICIDPGHGGTAETDQYRVGIAGEREEWVNLRVGLYLRELLEKAGATVIMTREEDVFVPLADRASMALENDADLFLSIHHNATADTSVSFPVMYFHGNASENLAGISLGGCLAEALLDGMYRDRRRDTPVSLVSDHTIFPKSGAAVLRETYGIPALIVEASFFSNPAEEQRLKIPAYNRAEAEAYLAGIRCFFQRSVPPIHPKNSLVPPFEPLAVLEEADRMNEAALAWKTNYETAKQIVDTEVTSRYEEAGSLLLQSITAFPDSHLAGECLELYILLMRRMGNEQEALAFEKRRLAFYPKVF